MGWCEEKRAKIVRMDGLNSGIKNWNIFFAWAIFLSWGFFIFGSQGIGSNLVSFQMIFEALQSELFRFKFHSLGFKLQKISEFNLRMVKYCQLDKLIKLVSVILFKIQEKG